ncbi:agamous-like MADS-box protein AGL86 [Papaver somniferum]|uniref:agamous-like MADS-box protein AGL86 n=1 Tax=Papaver somniferum TaxID=3469 RepID=UPI000E700A54|nr:agamous-like MADS-box protein AGL86 [Papaver somniferum]
MARKKVTLAYIASANARKATFNKRRKGLLKIVRELSTLCGVSACAIVNGPYDPQPEVWPDEQSEAHRVLMWFKSVPEIELRNDRKQFNPESFAKYQIGKISEQCKRYQQENHYLEINRMYNSELSLALDERKDKEAQRKLPDLQKASIPVVQTISDASDDANITAIPHLLNYPTNANVNVGALENGHGPSGINGGTVTDGAMYGGVVNHHDQGGGAIIDGVGDQEIRIAEAATESSLANPTMVHGGFS